MTQKNKNSYTNSYYDPKNSNPRPKNIKFKNKIDFFLSNVHLVSATDRCTEQSPQRSMNSKKVHLFMFLTLYENVLPFVLYINTYAIMFKCFRFYIADICAYTCTFYSIEYPIT